MATLKSGFKAIAEPLICACLKSIVDIPVEQAIGWGKKHFTDHSQSLSRAIATANDRTWQAVELAPTRRGWFEKIRGLFRNADTKSGVNTLRNGSTFAA